MLHVRYSGVIFKDSVDFKVYLVVCNEDRAPEQYPEVVCDSLCTAGRCSHRILVVTSMTKY